jgi:hypothetical protein
MQTKPTPNLWTAATAAVLALAAARAPALPPEAPVGVDAPQPPDWLPEYRIDATMLDPCGRLSAVQTVRWTNPGRAPTNEIVFHCYARYRPSKEELALYQRTLESFRVNPRIAIDEAGRRFHLKSAESRGAPLEWFWDPDKDTVLHVRLPSPVAPGETAVVELAFDLEIANVHYRLGHWQGVTNLLNWHPTVAYYGAEGWDAPRFVGWHQPWFQEAGNYDVSLVTASSQEVVSSGRIVEQSPAGEGAKRVRMTGRGLRDFAMVVSKRHEVHEAEADGVRIQVHAFPEHRFYARQALATAVECIERYNRLIGPYPHPEFKVVESYFGWNGNETTGMVLIDERVFDAPKLGHVYVDHLVSHEILHQWFYATVGTNGFSETWMDEALVSHLTELRIHEKYGDKVELLDLPKMLRWLPNVDYDAFLHSGYFLYVSRGGKGSVLGPLPEIGNVHYLFFLAYDRGSKVVGMIHERLGDEAFYDFLRRIYAKYAFRILRVDDFQRELEEYTGEPWGRFFDDWLRSCKQTDWKIKGVDVAKTADGWRTTVRVRQLGEILEPTTLAIRTEKDGPWRDEVRILPEAGNYDWNGARVERVSLDEWRVTLSSDQAPRQAALDPHGKILDVNPANNRWKIEPAVRFAPLYTPLEEVPLTRPLDRPSFVFGPNIDAEGRVGVRGSWMRPNHYRISPFFAYSITPNDDVTSVGFDNEIMNFPLPNISLLARYEYTLATNLFDLPRNQGEAAIRWNQFYTTSFLYPNIAYADVYFRFGDNFFPDETFRPPNRPDVEYYRDIRAVGVRYHLDTRMPYWNPEQGFAFDGAVENGFRAFGAGESFVRGFGQIAFVRKLPDGLGYLSETRLASRFRGGIGSPDNGEHFRLGGAQGFRGQRSEDTEGSAFWLTGADWRFPIRTRMDRPLLDNTANWQSLYAAILYDVGEMFVLGESMGVDHALGVGLYFDVALFSFLERLTLRTEYSVSLRYGSDILWFGFYYAY